MTWYVTTGESPLPLRDALYDLGATIAGAVVETCASAREVARAALRRP